jgi:quercetin dioxygenase-like cupin family protein
LLRSAGDEGLSKTRSGTLAGLLTFLATGDQTQGRFALIEALTRKGNCPPRHIHRNEDESFYILEGEITALIGDQTIRGTPGTLIFGPRGVPHSFEIHSEQVRMLLLLTAAGLEGYFKQFCTPAAALTLPPPAEIPYADIQNLIAVASKYGIVNVPPKPRSWGVCRHRAPRKAGCPSSTV